MDWRVHFRGNPAESLRVIRCDQFNPGGSLLPQCRCQSVQRGVETHCSGSCVVFSFPLQQKPFNAMLQVCDTLRCTHLFQLSYRVAILPQQPACPLSPYCRTTHTPAFHVLHPIKVLIFCSSASGILTSASSETCVLRLFLFLLQFRCVGCRRPTSPQCPSLDHAGRYTDIHSKDIVC